MLAPFERIGRAVMDLGFGGFLEKFESHFGPGLTKALLVLIGLAIAALCGSVIWEYLLLPIAQTLPDPKTGPAYQFGKLVVITALFLMIVNQLLNLLDNYLKRGLRKRWREDIKEAERVFEETLRLRDEVQVLRLEAADNAAAAELVLDEAILAALDRGLITQEQADELRDLGHHPSGDPKPAA